MCDACVGQASRLSPILRSARLGGRDNHYWPWSKRLSRGELWRQARRLSYVLAAFAFAFVHSCSLAAVTPTPSVSLEADWKIKVAVTSDDGTSLTNVLEVTPPTWNTVNAERHEAVPIFNPKAGGWSKGARLQTLLAQECTTRYLLDPSSLVLRTSAAADAPPLAAGKVYDADLEWGTFGRLAGGALKEGEPVFANYRHGLLRLDSVVLTADRRIELRTGEAKSAAPAPPQLREGERRLANIWLPGVIAKLGPENLFQVLEANFPEPTAESPSPA